MRISIITATYNNVGTVERCLGSLLGQSYGKVEHVVVDGASTDGTVEVIRKLSPDSKVISEPDKGLYHALNKGLGRVTGEVVGLLHADDTFASEKTIALIAERFDDPAVVGTYGDLEYVRPNDTVLRRWKAGAYRKNLLRRGWMPPHPTLFLRREIYEKFGNFDTRYSIAADYDFMLRILGTGNTPITYIPETLIRMTTGGMSNGSVRNIIRKSADDFMALRRNRIGWAPAVLFAKNVRKAGQFL